MYVYSHFLLVFHQSRKSIILNTNLQTVSPKIKMLVKTERTFIFIEKTTKSLPDTLVYGIRIWRVFVLGTFNISFRALDELNAFEKPWFLVASKIQKFSSNALIVNCGFVQAVQYRSMNFMEKHFRRKRAHTGAKWFNTVLLWRPPRVSH